MKRLIGYLTLGVSLLGAVAVGVSPAILSTKGNSDYSFSNKYVFKISEKRTSNDFSYGTGNGLIETGEEEQSALSYTMDIVKSKLSNANISNYKLETLSNDTFSLTFKDMNGISEDIISYLTYSNSLMAASYDWNYSLGYTVSDLNSGVDLKDNSFFVPGSANVQYRDSYPYVVVKLADPEEFQTMIDGIKDSDGKGGSASVSVRAVKKAEGEEETDNRTDAKKVLYVLNNWLNGFTLESLLSGSNKYLDNNNFSNYVVTYFDVSKPSSFYWDYDTSLSSEDQKKATHEYIYFGNYNLGAINGESGINVSTSYSVYNTLESDPTKAHQKASLFAHKFNSQYLKYDLTVINESQISDSTNTVSPFIEYLTRAGSIQMSSLLIGSLVIVALVFGLFIFKFRVAGILPAILTVGNTLAAFGISNYLGNEFNLGTVLGLLVVTVMSFIGFAWWLEKVKNEAYLGKNLKKAYQETNKNTWLFLLDLSVIGLVIGLVCYLIPNQIANSIGSTLLIGSFVNALTNGIIFRGFEWFLYNSNLASKHPALIGVSKKLVPDLSKDEQPKFFDGFKKKTNKKGVIAVAGVAGILLIASIVGMIVFGNINGNIYNIPTNQQNTQGIIQLNVNSVSDDFNVDSRTVQIEEALTHFYTDQAGTKAAFSKATVTNFYYTYQAEETSTIRNREYYWVIDFGKVYDVTNEATNTLYYKNSSTEFSGNFKTVLNNGLNNDIGTEYEVTLSQSYLVSDDFNNQYVLYISLISVGILFAYFLLRFGPSKALSALVIGSAVLAIVPGIFVLVRASVTSTLSFGLIPLIALVFILFDLFFTSERQAYKENRRELSDLAKREERYSEVTNLTQYSVLYMMVGFIFVFGGMLFTKSIPVTNITMIIVGMFLAMFFIKVLQLPSEMLLTKGFNAIKERIKLPRKDKGNKPKSSKVDDGPQEAIFVGIND